MSFNAELYVHDLDRKALIALNTFPRIVKLLELYTSNVDEKKERIRFLTQAIRLKKLGYNMIVIPYDLKKQKGNRQKEKESKIHNDGKGIAKAIIDNQIQKGIIYLKDKKNREEVLAAGIDIAKTAYKIVKTIKG